MPLECREITDYIAYAEAHPTWINRDRWLLINNIIRPMLERDDLTVDQIRIDKCVRYIEANYFPLFPYQKFIIAIFFIYADGFPLFSKFFIMEGRGNGKDGLIGALANFLQTPMFGVKDYHIDLVANSESQIKDTYAVVYKALKNKPKFKGLFEITKEVITNIATGSELRFNTANASTKDGKRPGCIIFNEVHAYENYDQINVFESALGKVAEDRVIIITTDGKVRGGPLDDYLSVSLEILTTGENPLGWFPFICRWDSEKDAEDEDAWHKSNPSLEFMPLLARKIKQQYLEAKKIPSKWPEFVTKRGCLPKREEEKAVTSWNNILLCSYEDIELLTPRKTPPFQPAQRAVIGIDYADIRDFASAGRLTKNDDNYVWRQHTWICAQSPKLNGIKFPLDNVGLPEFNDFEIVDEPVIPVAAIIDWVEEQMTQFDVRKIIQDTYRYSLFRQIFAKRSISIESKDNPDGLVKLLRKIAAATGVIAPSVEMAFAEGKIDYGPSTIMRWYTNNTCTITDKYGNMTFGKIDPILRKTDGFFAFLAAFYGSGELEEVVYYV